jgi:transposase-like protein
MADKVKFKAFPTAFKLAAIKRLEAGEAVLPLARKLGVSRKVLHDWREAWKLDGPVFSQSLARLGGRGSRRTDTGALMLLKTSKLMIEYAARRLRL